MSVSLAPMKFSRADLSAYAASSTTNDQAITAPYTRIGSSSGTANLTGMASPVTGQLRMLGWLRTGDVLLKHDVTSTAANRLLFPGGDLDLGTSGRKAILCIYDSVTARWRGIV